MPDYGRAHKAMRRKLLATYIPGVTLCCRCKQPITERNTSRIHLDHNDTGPGWAGLAHKFCNESYGGQQGAAITHAKPAQPPLGRPSRDW